MMVYCLFFDNFVILLMTLSLNDECRQYLLYFIPVALSLFLSDLSNRELLKDATPQKTLSLLSELLKNG